MPLSARLIPLLLLAGCTSDSDRGSAPKPRPEWAQLSRRLTGESDQVRREALKKIAALPRARELLRGGIESPSAAERALAWDAIVALEWREFLKDAIAQIETDPSGIPILAAVALAPENELPRVRDAIASWISPIPEGALGGPRSLIALETWIRLRGRLDRPGWKAWLEKSGTAHRWAALGALRVQLLRDGLGADLDSLRLFLRVEDPALKRRAQAIAGELTPDAQKRLAPDVLGESP